MLNLLRFRDRADYEAHPELAPDTTISGRQAYERYVRHTQPHLEAVGGSVIFVGDALPFLVGPTDETWDAAMLVRHASLDTFLGMANHPGCMEGAGHRLAALEDSRLLPILAHDSTELPWSLSNSPGSTPRGSNMVSES